MYVPTHFAQDDPALLLEVMQRYAFATLISIIDGAPFASHVPVLAHEIDGVLQIDGHVARANVHWQALQSDPQALVIFHGPHTYFSPTLYEGKNFVPTWNYIAVHASGLTRIEHSDEIKLAMLKSLIAANEPSYQAQFDRLDDAYRNGNLNAIVAFRLTVSKLEGKFKLGQHRLAVTKPEAQVLHELGNDNQRDIAAWMKQLGYWK